jgi:hypothetical protein
MVAFDEEVFRDLNRDAKSRNISLQAFLRAVVVPEWIRKQEKNDGQSSSNT